MVINLYVIHVICTEGDKLLSISHEDEKRTGSRVKKAIDIFHCIFHSIRLMLSTKYDICYLNVVIVVKR